MQSKLLSKIAYDMFFIYNAVCRAVSSNCCTLPANKSVPILSSKLHIKKESQCTPTNQKHKCATIGRRQTNCNSNSNNTDGANFLTSETTYEIKSV